MTHKWINRILWLCVCCLGLAVIAQGGQSIPERMLMRAPVLSLDGLWEEAPEPATGGSAYRCRLPEQCPENALLALGTAPEKLEVYLDGERVYSLEGGRAASAGSHWIELPGETANRLLEVRSADSGDALRALLNGRCYVGDRGAVFCRFLRENLYALLFGFFALMAGLLIWRMGFRLRKRSPMIDDRGMYELAGFVLCAGVWVVTDSHLLQLVTGRVGAVAMTSFVSFLMMPVFLLRFLDGQVENGKLAGLQKPYLVNATLCLALHLAGWLPLYRTIIVQHVLIVLTMGMVLKEIVSQWRQTGRETLRKVLRGFSMLFVCGIAALAEFYLNFADGRYPYFYSLGILLLTVCLLDAGLAKYMEYMARSARGEAYRKLAYADAMTGLGNRAAYLSDMEQSGAQSGLTFVMMDINNLKEVNDQYGHQAGDELIQAAADAMKRVFGGRGQSYRLGGDEFLVVLQNASQEAAEQLLEQLDRTIAEANRKRSFPVQIAWGCAMAGERRIAPEQLFREADANMYRRKQGMKGQVRSETVPPEKRGAADGTP